MGSSVVATSFLNHYLSPFIIIFVSLFLGTITALLFNGKIIFKSIRHLSFKRWQILFVQGFVGIFLYRIFLIIGVGMSSAAEAGIIKGATPALTTLLTYFILRELLNRRSIVGIFMTIIGVLLLQGVPFDLAAFNIQHFAGNMLVLASALCESIFAIFARKLHIGHSSSFQLSGEAQAGIAVIIAFAFSIMPMLLEQAWRPLGAMPSLGWAVMCWYGILSTFGAFAFMFKGAEFCDGYTIAALTGLIPLSALILAIVLLGDHLGPSQLAGGILVISSIWVMSRRPKV